MKHWQLFIILGISVMFYAGCRLLVYDNYYCIKEAQLGTEIKRDAPTGMVVMDVIIEKPDYETFSYVYRQDFKTVCRDGNLIRIEPIGEPIFIEQPLEEIKCK